MSRVNVFDLVKTISQESVTTPDVGSVKVDVVKDLPDNVQTDTKDDIKGDGVDAAVTDTKTTQPGPKDGGGDGTAQTVDVKNVKTGVSTTDLKFKGDQNGGKATDDLPNTVKVNDGLAASDVRTSVEEHDEKATGEVSDLKTIEAGGAEQVAAADDMVMDIESEVGGVEATGILSQSETDAALVGTILSDTGELEKAKASVERYIGILDRMAGKGVEMSNELREAMAIGLENISADLFEPEIVTLEAFKVSNEDGAVVATGRTTDYDDDDSEFDGARDKTKKGLGGKLKQIWEAIKRAFFRSLSAMQDLWQSFTADTGKTQEHLKDLLGRVKALEGGSEMTIKNATRLMIGDEFVGDSRSAIKEIAKVSEELLLKWPSALGEILKAVKAGRGIFGGTKTDAIGPIIDAFEDAITKSFRGLTDLSPKDKDKAPSGFLNVESLSWSKPLPGNRALYVGIERSKNQGVQGTLDDAAKLGNTVNINFSAVPGYETNAGEATVTIPSAGEANGVIRELQQLLNIVVGRKEGMGALKDLADTVKRNAGNDIFMGKISNEASVVGFLVGLGVANKTVTSEHAFIGYLISTVKAYIGFFEGCIKAEAGSGTTIDA